MGLIDFVKNAGAKVFGYETDAMEQDRERAKGKSLENHVRTFGIDVEGLRVDFDDEAATVFGTAKSQQDREKVALIVGNVEGVSKVDDRMRVVAPEPEAQYYTVVRGDTLSKIAKQYYGDAMKYPVIFEANKPMLKNPDLIYPGQVLRIPPLQ